MEEPVTRPLAQNIFAQPRFLTAETFSTQESEYTTDDSGLDSGYGEQNLEENKKSEIDWDHFSEVADPEYLEYVSKFVGKHEGQYFILKNSSGSKLRIAALEDTIYRDEPNVVDEWGEFYLPEIVNMQILGVVEGTSCSSDEFVLMTCEDRRLYGYDGEELHVVAERVEQLKHHCINYPSNETYYNGQAFKDMTKEDWEEVRRGDVGQMLEKEHKKLVAENKSAILESLKSQK
ncbi:uncharacterized protein LOC106536876 [Austrofundulus limnaeus]|uniref:Uncharacterized protein LOC106536876 n=1 Tax=Austrofundulus limnaeus TaxID=52670 RepID=A0A2I4DBR2_AUSLI|nr:PREDICTED: uncharacterized protein LOC106536876 [Austrofundulus limnaeus]XP_013889673.1 PREDICTED: uncharacterized protein LOC106536876 [Austrofundulus limnaeus]